MVTLNAKIVKTMFFTITHIRKAQCDQQYNTKKMVALATKASTTIKTNQSVICIIVSQQEMTTTKLITARKDNKAQTYNEE